MADFASPWIFRAIGSGCRCRPTVVSRFRSSQVLAAPLMRTSKSKEIGTNPPHLDVALFQQWQCPRRNLLPPKRMRLRVGVKPVASEQVRLEPGRKSLYDQ